MSGNVIICFVTQAIQHGYTLNNHVQRTGYFGITKPLIRNYNYRQHVQVLYF